MCVRRGYDMMQAIFVCEGIFFAFKFLPMFRKGERIKRCISYFDGVEYGPQDKTEQQILNNSVVLCQIITKFYIICISSCQVLFLLPALFSSGYELPLRMWLPYSTTSSLINYYATYAYIWTVISYCALTNASLDPLIGGLMFQAVSQLKILKHRIQNPENFDQDTFHATLLENYIYQRVVECIKYHTEILNFINEVDQCFSWCVFNQFSGTASLLCFLITAILTVPVTSIDGMQYIVFFFLILSQVLFYCYFGTLLFEEPLVRVHSGNTKTVPYFNGTISAAYNSFSWRVIRFNAKYFYCDTEKKLFCGGCSKIRMFILNQKINSLLLRTRH
ncbi:odorant receptor 33a-like isoform X1 [Zophobas morio]|uniref:odorant receptor 33a-like isoform X1 n=1 Tax=Zophobas morio TaxID=2755281 RepID=UPI0030830308